MSWWKQGNYSHTPNEVTWSKDISADAKQVFNMIASSIPQFKDNRPVFLTYVDIHTLTGWSEKRICSAIRELVERKIVLFRKGGLRLLDGQKRKASEFSVNPKRKEWQVGRLFHHPCASLPSRKREDVVASSMAVNSLPSRKANEEKENRNATTEVPTYESSTVGQEANMAGAKESSSRTPKFEPAKECRNSESSQSENHHNQRQHEEAEIERYANDPRFVEAFGSSEKVRTHFLRKRGLLAGEG